MQRPCTLVAATHGCAQGMCGREPHSTEPLGVWHEIIEPSVHARPPAHCRRGWCTAARTRPLRRTACARRSRGCRQAESPLYVPVGNQNLAVRMRGLCLVAWSARGTLRAAEPALPCPGCPAPIHLQPPKMQEAVPLAAEHALLTIALPRPPLLRRSPRPRWRRRCPRPRQGTTSWPAPRPGRASTAAPARPASTTPTRRGGLALGGQVGVGGGQLGASWAA